MRKAFVFVALVSLFAAPAAFGQAQRGTITVTVTAEDGSLLPGATVEAQSDQTLTRRLAVTDEQGIATLVALAPAANYVVSVGLEGFGGARFEEIEVRAGQTTSLKAALGLAEVREELVVTSQMPLVDTTSAIAGQQITLQLTESLPTARSYQDYLQLVPGVQDDIDGAGNPASRSGVNYRDSLGEVGRSTDNAYYFDGINVTDRVTGTFGADLNTEIIQEQSVLTGGIPAEFVGAPGLISNVVTKSGGNQLSGSINYYFQDDSLVESNDNFGDQTFSRFDAAATLGGPIVRDRAWFFASYRVLERDDDVFDSNGNFLRSVSRDEDQAFGKVSWAITQSDLVTGIYLSDPTTTTGERDNTLSNAEDFSRDQGGERYSGTYSRVFPSVVLELGYTDHRAELDTLSNIREPQNSVAFRNGDPFTDAEAVLGGDGEDQFQERGIESARGSLEYLLDTSWGAHTLKGGADLGESYREIDDQLLGDPTAEWISISQRYQGQNLTLFQVDGTEGVGFTLSEFTSDNADSVNGFNAGLADHPQGAQVIAAYDTNGDGFLDGDELGAGMLFNDTTGNPNGQINYSRDLQVSSGARSVNSEYQQYYIQDTWQWNRWSVNAGLRAERWEHFAASGDQTIDFDWDYAPRVSVVYDINGNGRQRVSAFYGRYFDPIRNNMTLFAGDNQGRVLEEQVWVDAIQDWVTFRTRGGSVQIDGFFAPTIETPYTDEIQLGYAVDLGRNMAFEVNLIDRETKDIMEDYGVFYFDAASFPGDTTRDDTLFLGPEYLGFTAATLPPANFIIATLPSGTFRDYQGVELIFRKRFSNHWQALASYNFADQEGNSISDSNADLAGDLVYLDPRAPNLTSTLPGLVEHLFKAAGNYSWDNGFQVGARYRWNSGAHLNTSGRVAFNRHEPLRVAEAYEFSGLNQRWVAPNSLGSVEVPSYGILDLRFSYVWNINDRLDADFFVDVFNTLDDQEPVKVQDLVGGGDNVAFEEGVAFVDPRRYFLGARLRF